MTQTPDPVSAQPASPVFAPAPGSAVVQVSGHLVSHDAQSRPIGKVRSTGMCFVLMVVTLGFYSLFWFYGTHSDMKRYAGSGLGGGLAALLGLFLGPVMMFVSPSEVSGLFLARRQHAPVSAVTGCWILVPFVGLIIWFVKTNGALNSYWRSLGAA